MQEPPRTAWAGLSPRSKTRSRRWERGPYPHRMRDRDSAERRDHQGLQLDQQQSWRPEHPRHRPIRHRPLFPEGVIGAFEAGTVGVGAGVRRIPGYGGGDSTSRYCGRARVVPNELTPRWPGAEISWRARASVRVDRIAGHAQRVGPFEASAPPDHRERTAPPRRTDLVRRHRFIQGIPIGQGSRDPATIISGSWMLTLGIGRWRRHRGRREKLDRENPVRLGRHHPGPRRRGLLRVRQAIYGRHGISAPRTSEAQGAWVKRRPTPVGSRSTTLAGGADPVTWRSSLTPPTSSARAAGWARR